MRRRTVLLSSTGILALTAGCLGGDEENQETNTQNLPEEGTIEASDGAFDPLSTHIAPGGTVTWENVGDESYRINAYQFTTAYTAWDYSETIESGESVTHTFEEEGLYGFTDHNRGGEYSICGQVRIGNANEGRSLPCE